MEKEFSADCSKKGKTKRVQHGGLVRGQNTFHKKGGEVKLYGGSWTINAERGILSKGEWVV